MITKFAKDAYYVVHPDGDALVVVVDQDDNFYGFSVSSSSTLAILELFDKLGYEDLNVYLSEPREELIPMGSRVFGVDVIEYGAPEVYGG